jgi:hypothetical protein
MRPLLLYALCLFPALLLLCSENAAAQERGAPRDSVAVRPVCIQDEESNTRIRSDTVLYRLAQDSVVLRGGQRLVLSEVRPRVVGFAAAVGGFVADSTCSSPAMWPHFVRVFGGCYTMFGPPRRVPTSALTEIGLLDGITVFFARGTELRDLGSVVFYVLRDEDCLFQPYSIPVI